MTLWGSPDRVHVENMEQLNAYNFYQTELQATEYHKNLHMNCESGLQLQYVKHAAHRLVQHMLQVEMAWTNYSTLAILFYMHYW